MEIPRRGFGIACALVAGAAFHTAPAPVHAQTSAEQILHRSAQEYEARMQDVQNYTIVQSWGGASNTLYFERVETADGRPRFRSLKPVELSAAAADDDDAAGLVESGGGEVAAGMTDPYALFDEIVGRAELQGTETVDGSEAYVLSVDDLSGIDFGMDAADPAAGSGQQARFEPETMKLWMDADRYVALRMVLTGTFENQGQESEVTFDARMSDFRAVEGMLHPFHTEVAMEGLGGAPGVSPEQRAELERARKQMEEQLKGLSDEQRALAERMMKGRMPDLDAMTGSGPMTTTIEVTELRVNEGPPESMSDLIRRAAAAAAQDDSPEDRPAARGAGADAGPTAAAEPDRGPRREDLGRFQGRYASPDRPNRVYSISESCIGSGDLQLVAEWGDVQPPILRGESDTRFVEVYDGPRDRFVIDFQVGGDGSATGATLDDPFNDPVTLDRIGPLMEGWEPKPCGAPPEH